MSWYVVTYRLLELDHAETRALKFATEAMAEAMAEAHRESGHVAVVLEADDLNEALRQAPIPNWPIPD